LFVERRVLHAKQFEQRELAGNMAMLQEFLGV
jgi:hypothetical protein